MYVTNQYTANKLFTLSQKLGFEMKYQWVKKGDRRILACDFYKF